jgi:hypothetical protein
MTAPIAPGGKSEKPKKKKAKVSELIDINNNASTKMF